MSAGTMPRSTCPTDERLAEMVENRLPASARTEIEAHIARCPECADVVASAAAAAAPSWGGAYRRLEALEPVTVATRSRRRWLPIAAGFAIAATAALGYVGATRLLDRGATVVAARASARLGVPVQVGALSVAVQPTSGAVVLHLTEVRVGGSRPAAPSGMAAAVELTLPLATLWRAAPAVTLVRLVHPVLHVLAGTSTPAADGGSADADPGSILALLLTDVPVEILDGVVHVTLPDRALLTLTQVNATGTPVAQTHRVRMSASVAGGSVHAGGTVAGATGGSTHVMIEGRDLALGTLPFVSEWLRGTGDVDIVLSTAGAAPLLAGRARVRAGSVPGWNPLPTLAAASGAAPALAAIPPLAGPDLAFDDLRATFAADRARWRLPRFSLDAPLFSVLGSLRGTGTTLTGTGSVRLARGAADALRNRIRGLDSQLETDGALTLPFTIAGSARTPVFTPRF
jgi:hypothetical protein